jgi:predicted RNA-binding protein Jag
MKNKKNSKKDTQEATETIEVEGTTIEAAIRKAIKTLKAKKQEVTIEVLKEEHKGLFGMEGAKRAHIRATRRPSK